MTLCEDSLRHRISGLSIGHFGGLTNNSYTMNIFIREIPMRDED